MKSKICHICIKELPAIKEYFSKRSREKDLLNVVCKNCDNTRRRERFKNKSSHNICRICKYCSKVFYAEFCKVKIGRSIFCSVSCKIRQYHKEKKDINHEQTTNF